MNVSLPLQHNYHKPSSTHNRVHSAFVTDVFLFLAEKALHFVTHLAGAFSQQHIYILVAQVRLRRWNRNQQLCGAGEKQSQRQ